MKQLIVKLERTQKNVSFSGLLVTSFDEEYEKYLRRCKKKQWATVEGFSLEFDSLLSDLKKSIFIYTDSKSTIDKIRKKFNVIEENEISN